MIKKIKEYYDWGGRFLTNQYHITVNELSIKEVEKKPTRTDIINYLLASFKDRKTAYLEIGVRNPEHNFNHIKSYDKYSVDSGIEFKDNPVDFKMTSDEFFIQLKNGIILNSKIKFDVIFIDGLHLADQVNKDIINSLKYIKDDGYIVLHDCSPPSEWHAREEYLYDLSPAMHFWNGTTWKAFYKFRLDKGLTSACVETDWGIGILTKKNTFNNLDKDNNPFFEYKVLEKNRKEFLNLISLHELKKIIGK